MLTPHGIQCRPSDSSLPDGCWLHYQRNGQGQVTALVRSPVQRPWLRKLAAEDAIASHLQRNLVGLQSYTAGNGIHSQWLRDGTGTLAGIVHSRPSAGPRQLHAQAQAQARIPTTPTPLWPATASVVQRLLGIGNAQASTAPSATTPATPAALAFFDERYLWSGDGLLLHSQRRHQGAAQQRYWAYDGAGQLVAGVQTSTTTDTATDTQVWRYAYQDQRRVLAQHTASQDELTAGTTRTHWDAQGRPTHQDAATTYNANGQPTGQGQRSYQWDALGRLTSIHAGETTRQEIARYHYDHRGLRIAKDAGGRTTSYLYSADRHLLAELNASGHIQRQYIYLADLLLAVIDTPKGAKLAQTVPEAAEKESPEPLEQTIGLWADVKALLSSYLPGNATLAYIHSNHLGAPEAATNENGELVWQASYAPFGAAAIQNQQSNFTLNIRLPGQYADEETGLHYNRQRYYDPAQGAYLTPDPLGHPDGPNAYAYVANNPLGWIDPDGLVLFAFDGTGNDESDRNALTNVVNFRDLYRDDGGTKYVTGVGTDHKGRDNYGDIISKDYDKTIVPFIAKIPDRGGNYSGPARIERMLLYFVDAAEAFENNNEAMNIDIVGFSRGAAQARDFANRLVGMLKDGAIWYQKHDPNTGRLSFDEAGNPIMGCQVVNFRFMGIFDTVLSTNFSEASYNLSIPSQFEYVAHAVALNEHRSTGPAGEEAFWTAPIRNFPSWDKTRLHLPQDDHYGGFPLQSIGASSSTPGQIRIELGFIGAHSDIGGGYTDGGVLSDVALAWMLRQAVNAGVQMDESFNIDMQGTAVLHDQANTMRFGNPNTAPSEIVIKIPTGNTNTYPDVEYETYKFPVEDREVRGAVGGSTQRTQSFSNANQTGGATSMVNADTYRFIHYDDRGKDKDGIPTPQSNMPSNKIPELQDRAPSKNKPCTPSTPGNCNRTGTVDLPSYIRWLLDNGYEL
ncbi:RHS repeat-associated core domain-containing protein [Comamonas nitrativorans]|uniref:RHS repeat-associated core domain-containing protein n=1 Tax=Comamonas nitrativorans TaxID=108437 RepID=A0ABV9GWG4_9BURK